MFTARVGVGDHKISVVFTVFDASLHDIILGLDVLTRNVAIIDCATAILRLDRLTGLVSDTKPPNHLDSQNMSTCFLTQGSTSFVTPATSSRR